MAEPYVLTYCVSCKQKTEWSGQPTLKHTRNNRNGLRGTCVRCNKTKFTFVSKSFVLSSNANKSPSTPDCETPASS